MEGEYPLYDYDFFRVSNPSCNSCVYIPNCSQENLKGEISYCGCYSPIDSDIDCFPSCDYSSADCCSCFGCCSSADCCCSSAGCYDTFLEMSDTPINMQCSYCNNENQSYLLPRSSSVLYHRTSSLPFPPFCLENDTMLDSNENIAVSLSLPNEEVAFPTSVNSEVLFNEPELKEEEEGKEEMNSNRENRTSKEENLPNENPITEIPLFTTQSKKESFSLHEQQEIKQELAQEQKQEQEQEQDRESDDDWTLLPESESLENPSGRNPPKMWTKEECDRLYTAIHRFGVGHWTEISRYVGSRCVSQCINKWKNSLSKKRERWTAAATKQLKEYVNNGATEKEIAKLMPQYTYIQLYQQIRKLQTNSSPWAEWEIELLIKLKLEGRLGDTEIGRQLNNRHRDNVKNVWNRIRREQNL